MNECRTGWEKHDLGEVVTHKKGFAFKSEKYLQAGVRIIRISDTTRDSIHNEHPVFWAENEAENFKEYRLNENDIVLSTVGSRPHLPQSMVGKAIRVPRDAAGSLLNQNLVKLIPKASKITNQYLYEILKNRRFISYLSALVRGNANQVSISLSDIFSFRFVLPPLPEQKKIAQILSIWDKAITATQRLLENSQQRKKGLMQQLLTGKKRLPGFEGEWENSILTNHCSVVTGNKDLQNKVEDGEYPFFVRSDNIERIDSYSFEGEAILIPGDGRVGEIFHYINGKFDFHQRVYKLSDFEGAQGLFIYYYLKRFFKAEVTKNSVKATVDSLRMPVFTGMRIKLPSLVEQQSIVDVLSCSDREVQAITRQLNLLKEQKKALMQQLLTGKRRVKVETEAA
jgi:type I restriction enzyme S subunit